MTGKTYSILRSRRVDGKTVETVIETGLTWEVADSKRDKIAQEDRDKYPLRSSWVRDMFEVRMENV